MKKPISPKIKKLFSWSLILILFLVVVYLFPEIYLYPADYGIIKPQGETSVNTLLSEINSINQTEEKFERIVEWEAENYTEFFAKEPDLKIIGMFGRYDIHLNSSNSESVKIRAYTDPFKKDTYWLAFFKCGACSERAVLFNNIVNQSGYVSRVVGSAGNDHVWAEVYVGSEWIYVDPTFYYYYHDAPGLEKGWMNKTPQLEKFWGWNLSKVTTEPNETELTDKYAKVGNLSILFSSSDRVSVIQNIPGEHRNVTLFSNKTKDFPHNNNLVYQLGLFNTYIIVGEKDNYPFPTKWIDEKIVGLENESTTVVINPKSGREEIDYIALGAYGFISLLYIFLFYWIYRNRKRKKEQMKM